MQHTLVLKQGDWFALRVFLRETAGFILGKWVDVKKGKKLAVTGAYAEARFASTRLMFVH